VSNEEEFCLSRNIVFNKLSSSLSKMNLNNTIKLTSMLKDVKGVAFDINDSSDQDVSQSLLENLDVKELKESYSRLIQESAEEFLSIHTTQ